MVEGFENESEDDKAGTVTNFLFDQILLSFCMMRIFNEIIVIDGQIFMISSKK